MKQSSSKMLILGAGVTGLAAGWASGLPMYEAEEAPGGICSSYYLRPGGNGRMDSPPQDGEPYQVEMVAAAGFSLAAGSILHSLARERWRPSAFKLQKKVGE